MGDVTTWIDDVATALTAEGVRALFGISGSGASLQLITAMERRDIPFYGTSHEASAAIMAGAFGRFTGTVGCSISIKGPGFGNMLAGVLTNWYENVPALSIAEAFGSATPSSRMHKRLDHHAALLAWTKAHGTAGNPRTTVPALLATARAEVPGPVHLDLTEDVQAMVASTASSRPGTGAAAADWPAIQRLVERAARPAVIAGSLATRRAWGARLGRLRIPVFATFAAKGVVDESRPFAAGVFTGDGKTLSPEATVLAEADLVIGLGLRNLEVLTPRSLSAPSVIVDVVEGPANGFGATGVCVAGSDEPFDTMLDLLDTKAWGEALVVEATTRVRRHLVDGPWLPGSLYEAVADDAPDVGRFVVDTGFFCTVAEHVWRAPSPDRFLASANGRSMGTAIPMAIGAALADRASPTVCAVGDGGIRMYVADVKLAVEERLPILFVLLSDGRYGSIAGTEPARGLSRRATTIARPSWSRVMDALDCPAAHVKDRDGFAAALESWDRRGPCFIEAVFDPDAYAAMIAGVR